MLDVRFDITGLRRDYGDAAGEARSCRQAAALFDFSFVARARLEGPGAVAAIGRLTGRPIADMRPGTIRYAVRSDAGGRLLSDLTVWRYGQAAFEVMSGRCADIDDLGLVAGKDCTCLDLSAETAILALQGPAALDALAGMADTGGLARLGYFQHDRFAVAGIDCRVGRLGYTGEAGFEILAPRNARDHLWGELGIRARPAGFAAADQLRIEAGFMLFAHEFALPVSAVEAGLGRFAGGDRQPEPEITLICVRAKDRPLALPWRPAAAPVRPTRPGEVAVTSACRSPLTGGVLALGYVRTADLGAAAGPRLFDQAGEFADVVRVGLPVYDPSKLRPRRSWPHVVARPL